MHGYSKATRNKANDPIARKGVATLGKFDLAATFSVDNNAACLRLLLRLRELDLRDLLLVRGRSCYGDRSVELIELLLNFRQKSLQRDTAEAERVVKVLAILDSDPFCDAGNDLGKLRLSRDFASFRHAPDLIAGNFGGMGHMTAARGDGYGYVYSPLGVPFTVNLEAFAGAKRLRASWFDPRTGKEKVFGVLPAAGKTLVVPPAQGKGCDWVLVLEEV